MSATRISRGISRGGAIAITVDNMRIECFTGETLATAMLAAGQSAFRTDSKERERGLFCNMGACSECIVTLLPTGRRVRACLVEAQDGMKVATHG